jgi:hypothetical protein
MKIGQSALFLPSFVSYFDGLLTCMPVRISWAENLYLILRCLDDSSFQLTLVDGRSGSYEVDQLHSFSTFFTSGTEHYEPRSYSYCA